MTHCRTCGAALDPDWCDCYCPPCLEQVYERLAEALLTAFLSGYRGAILHRRMPTSAARRWACDDLAVALVDTTGAIG